MVTAGRREDDPIGEREGQSQGEDLGHKCMVSLIGLS